MNAIGGIVNFEGQGIAPRLAVDMSRAMLCRAKEQRGAYLTKQAALIHNRSLTGEPTEARQPRTVTQNGRRYTVVLDGTPSGIGELTGMGRELGIDCAAELILDCYIALGASFVEHLAGAFAFAIYDEERGEVFFARDREGRRPLFYAEENGTLAFASEIKALLRFLPGTAQIDSEALRAHFLSPCGTVSPETLYREIRALPPGHCAIYSRMGMTVYAYAQTEQPQVPSYEGEPISPEAVCPSLEDLKEILTRAVFAFDYPQFDYLMPGLFWALREQRPKKRAVPIEDGTLHMNIGYAYERADRLGAILGVELLPICPLTASSRQRELKKTDRMLRDLLAEADGSRLSRWFGVDWREAVGQERNPIKRIRMQGILYQTELWIEHYRLAVV